MKIIIQFKSTSEATSRDSGIESREGALGVRRKLCLAYIIIYLSIVMITFQDWQVANFPPSPKLVRALRCQSIFLPYAIVEIEKRKHDADTITLLPMDLSKTQMRLSTRSYTNQKNHVACILVWFQYMKC